MRTPADRASNEERLSGSQAGGAEIFERMPKPSAVVIVLVAYACWLLTTPYKRFEILEFIHFERWIVLALLLAWIFSPPSGARQNRVTAALGVLFTAMILSYLLSDYQGVPLVQHWASEYWKELVLFFFIAYGIGKRDQLAAFLVGIAAISLIYQAYTWLDFLSGGSYVYQQGMRRMMGVWSGGGLGAANEWGSFALYSLPLGVLWCKVAWSRLQMLGGAALLLVSAASIVASGTRAAFVVGALFALFHWRKQVFRPARLLLLGTLLAVTWTQLPEAYRARIEMIWAKSDSAQLSRTQQIAVDSGKARILGLKDGWKLFLDKPVLGYGPGASRSARAKFHPDTPAEDLEQLHNLYGQLLSELGALGVLGFALLVLAIFRATRLPPVSTSAESPTWAAFSLCIRSLLVLLLLYGMFSHTLYQDYWLLVAGLAVAFASALDSTKSPSQQSEPNARGVRKYGPMAK